MLFEECLLNNSSLVGQCDREILLLGGIRDRCCIQLLRERLLGEKVHATIPKGNMGYDQYTVPGTVAVESTFVAFLYHSQTYVHGLSCHSFKFH